MNKEVKILIDEAKIQNKVLELAGQIKADYNNKPLVVIGVLNGAVIFLSDLVRKLDMDLEIGFMDISSYREGTTSGELVLNKDINYNINGKDVLIVEDIIDTGKTIKYLCEYLSAKGANSIKICACLSKPARRETEVNIDYLGFEIEDKFVIGYGLDYAEKYRNLPYIGYLE